MKKRAIVVYLERKKPLMLQFNSLYESLKYINCDDTDLVVFGTNEALIKVPDDCIKVECPPLSSPSDWLSYRFINSISCLVSDKSDFLEGYEYILRTDLDTFLTPAWNTFYPALYTVGRGGYVNNDEVRENIKRISEHFGLKHKGIYNIGSSHYGSAFLVREVCRLALKVANYLITVEFKNQKGAWPGWYFGVITMYSMEIAANHLVEKMIINDQLLDFGSASEDSIVNHPHIHCWHTNNVFSKFYFADGKYDSLWTGEMPSEKVKDYCLYIALKSKYNPSPSLKQIYL
ncbi:MAG: hypothetical protein ACM3UU_08315 [Ignavibacteriales bacterium]